MALAAVGMALAVVTVAMAMMGQPEGGPTGACCNPEVLSADFIGVENEVHPQDNSELIS